MGKYQVINQHLSAEQNDQGLNFCMKRVSELATDSWWVVSDVLIY